MADQGDLARELLHLAEDDRAAGHALLDVRHVSDAIVGFHPQQAVGKAFKAVLVQLCDDVGLQVPPSLAEADLLTPYGATFRYDAESPGVLDRAAALALAAPSTPRAAQRRDDAPQAASTTRTSCSLGAPFSK